MLAQLQIAITPNPLDTCSRWDKVNGVWDKRCGAPAKAVLTYVCVHEHIREGGCCAEHVESENRQCMECRFGPEQHACDLLEIGRVML